MERLASNGESFYIQKHPLKKTKQPSRKEICCRGKSKELGDKIDVQCTGETIIINKMKTI